MSPHSQCPKQTPESLRAHFPENNAPYADQPQALLQGFVPMTGSLFSCRQIDEAMALIIGFQHSTSLLWAQLELIVFVQHLIHGWLGSINSTDGRWHRDLQLQKDFRAVTKHSSDNCLIVNLSKGYPQPDEQKARRTWAPVNLGWSQKLCKRMSVYNEW